WSSEKMNNMLGRSAHRPGTDVARNRAQTNAKLFGTFMAACKHTPACLTSGNQPRSLSQEVGTKCNQHR
ncbi:MAG: hypothetical protein MI923_20905, partial [Phycisphaerales bacterium]|nr:hypothetical protein [Phycisphaerales bacterium]